jgi:hypothetical protein
MVELPKAMVVERIRSRGGAEQASRADGQLPDKIDTDTDAELLKKYDLDPNDLAKDFGGQSPMVG